MKAVGLKRGVVIVMNPQTGEILAMVSLPTYDNNLFARGHQQRGLPEAAQRTRTSRCSTTPIQAHYPPGSTYKLVTGTGGLADGKITADDARSRRKGYLTLGATKFYDWNHRGFGPCNIYCGFGHSSDTFFFQVAGMLGIDRLGYWAKQYGFGAPTGIDLPGEVSGIVPTNQWKQDTLGEPIFPGETYQAGIGQGYDVVTPIQLINAYAALANGGTLYQPQVVREIVGPDGDGRPAVQAEGPPQDGRASRASSRRCATPPATSSSSATRTTSSTCRSRSPASPARPSSGRATRKGRLPFHSWFVGFVAEGPVPRLVRQAPTRSWSSSPSPTTRGRRATRRPRSSSTSCSCTTASRRTTASRTCCKRGNFYQSN